MDTILEFVKNNPHQVTAFAAVSALGVSFLSIVLTVVSLVLQRRHNFKSLTPIASFPIGDYENLITVKLKNTGVGPLIVEKFVATDGKQVRHSLISWMPETPTGVMWDTFYDSLEGLSVPPGAEAIIVKLSGDSNDTQFSGFRDDVRRVLSRLTVRVEYRDIYNRRVPKKQRDLKWFGRHFEN
jgi:hypothetical protein